MLCASVTFRDLVNNRVTSEVNSKKDEIFDPVSVEGSVCAEEEGDTSSGCKDDGVETIFLPDNHRFLQNSVLQHVEDERRRGQGYVQEDSCVVEPCWVHKAKGTSFRVNYEVSVNETDDTQEAKGLVKVVVVFLREKLLDPKGCP